jgi:HAMP domain-containing protein
VIVSISLIYTYESIRTEKRIIRSEIVKRAEVITSMATKNGELPLLSGSPRLLKNIASFLKAKDDVASVTFYDRGMKELIHEGAVTSAMVPQLTPSLPVVISELDDSYIFYAPIFAERVHEDADILHEADNIKMVKEHIGWVRLVFSKASMWAAEQKIVERGILLLLLFAGGSSAFVYILITLALRPLTRIVQIANGIADGEFSRDLEKHRHDEIGTLANAFQQMKIIIQQVLHETDALVVAVKEGRLDSRGNAEQFRGEWRKLMNGVNLLTEAFANGTEELHEAKNSLEKRVEERTVELAQANSTLLTEINERKRAEGALRLQAVELAEEVAERQIAQEHLQEKALMLEEEIEKRQEVQEELEKLNDELEQRVMLAELSAEIGCDLTSSGNLQNMLKLCSESLVRHLDVAFARIWTLNAAENCLEMQASAGMYTHIDGSHSRVPVGKFKIGLIAEERNPHITNDVLGDPRVHDQEWATREGMVAFAGHPLVIGDKLVGVMAMFSRNQLSDVTLKALESVSNEIAIGIERKLNEEALEQFNTELEQRVRQRTAELDTKNRELERFNKLFVNRELRMVELKERIKELENQRS